MLFISLFRINNCVGEKNFKYFYLFCVYTGTCVLYGMGGRGCANGCGVCVCVCVLVGWYEMPILRVESYKFCVG